MASKVNIVINGKNMASKAIKDVTKDLSSAHVGANKLNDGMMKLAKFGLGAAIMGASASVAASFASLKKSADFSDIRMQFETLLGSYAEAETMLTNLQNLSAKTPLQLTAVTEAATQLLAVGTDKGAVTDELRMLGDLAMGNEQKFGLLTDAYAKLRAKGKVSLEELNRFTENGVPLLGALAENLGVSNAELQKMVSSGKIKLNDIQQAMKDLTEEGGMFFGMMEKKSQGVNGKLSTLRDNLSMTMIKWGEAFEPLAGTLLDTAIQKLEEFSDSEKFKNFVATTVKWASWASNAIPKVGLTISMVAAIIGTTVKEAKDQLESIGSVVIKTPVIQAAIEMAGNTWDALKKGFQEGDWSDLFDVGIDIAKAGIAIIATVKLGEIAGKVMLTKISDALITGGFKSYTGVAIAGVVAAASIAIGLIEAINDDGQDFEAFGKNLVLALAAGIGIGTFTGSPAAGLLAMSIIMNAELGEKIFDSLDFHPIRDIKEWFENPQSLANSLKSSFIDIWRMSGVYAWLQGYGNDIGEDFGSNLLDSFWKVISVFDLVGAFIDLWKLYLSPLVSDIFSNGESVGKNFIEGFKKGIVNIWDSAIDKVGSFFSAAIDKGKSIL
ncbi:MAG: tape measure protein, partial [Sphaerochaetaceae bacterium]